MVTITKRTFICSVNVDTISSKVDVDSVHEGITTLITSYFINTMKD